MPFAPSDPLSELVWSPHNGLSLKCAKTSLADNKPFFTWDLGDSAKEISASMSIRSKGSGDFRVSDVAKSNASLKMLDDVVNRCLAGKTEKAGTTYIAETSRRSAGHDILADRKFNMAINWKIPSKLMRGTRFNRAGRLETHASRSDIMGLAVPIRSEKHHTAKASKALVCSLPNLLPQHEPGEEVTSNVDENKTKTSPPPILARLESFAENDLARLIANEACSLGKRARPREDRPRRGKEKALSSYDEDDSHESVESCTSAGLLSKGIKRRNFDNHEPVVGSMSRAGSRLDVTSKRTRKEIKGSYGSTSFVKSDSSFVNWISNMVKGLSDSNKEEPFPLPLTTFARSDNDNESLTRVQRPDCTRPVTGFQTVFQSLYCQNTKASASESPENLPRLFDGNNNNSCKQIVLSDKEVGPRNNTGKGGAGPSDYLCEKPNSTADKTSLDDIPLPMSCIPGKSSPLSSLWITRLYTRTSRLENCNEINEKACDCSSDGLNANLDNRANDVLSIDDHKLYYADSSGREMQSLALKTAPIQKLKSSEAMVSDFAKWLDALRHIIRPSEKRKSASCELICFFCGGSGHDVLNCPELTETELENLLVKISSFERVEESPRLCIRCFQLDHWAISCPSDDHKPVNVDHKPVSSSFPRAYLTWDVKGSSRKRLSSSNEFQRSSLSSSERRLKDKQIFPPRYFVDSHYAVRQEEVFHAVRSLRLSRADILRWMSSDASISRLNGFFLRLRLGKVEGGLGGTTYYVACIADDDTTESIDFKSKTSILVDVGGVKSSIGSQFISNHDFLEDEIKAWWSKIVKIGGNVPSLDELNSKFEDRKRLGL